MKGMQAMSMAMGNMNKVMKKMNKQMDPSKFAKIAQKFEQEAAKAELTEEIMSDTLGDAIGDDNEAEDELVNKVLEEAGLSATGDLLSAPSSEPVAQQNTVQEKQAVGIGAPATPPEKPNEECPTNDVDDLEARLKNLTRGDD